MLSVIFFWAVARVARIARREFTLPTAIKTQVHRVQHFFLALFVALEGHLLLVFVYPHFYPILAIVSHKLGVNLDGFYYGEH